MSLRGIVAIAALGVALAGSAAAQVEQENLDEFGTGIIKDYGNMTATETIEWVWIAPGVKLGSHRFEVKPVDNLTSYDDGDMEEMINKSLTRTMQRISARNDGAELLQITPAVYWAQRGNRAKVWIPFTGGHLAQAGIGLELVFTDTSGKEVAKIRHSGREGEKLQDAAEELIDDLRKFVGAN